MKLPVIVRLGDSTFLVVLGILCKTLVLWTEELFQCIYPGSETVDKIRSGGAYYRSPRAHFLVDAALCVFHLENEFSNEELAEMTQFISRYEKLGSNLTNRITQQFDERIQSKLSELSEKGRTAKLWMTYHTLVLKIKSFILAERILNHDLHLATVVDMLPTFAAAGHTVCQRRTIIRANDATKYNNIYLCKEHIPSSENTHCQV